MKRWMKIVAFLQLQVIFFGLLYLFVVQNQLKSKVKSTNRFIYEILGEQRHNKLTTLTDADIKFGEDSASHKLVIYSRFDCSACDEFYKENFESLLSNDIKSGHIQIGYRFLTHENKPESLLAVKGAKFAFQEDFFEEYMQVISSNHPNITEDVILGAIPISFLEAFKNYASDEEIENTILYDAQNYRQSGISATPTTFINGRKEIGSMKYKRLKKLIEGEI